MHFLRRSKKNSQARFPTEGEFSRAWSEPPDASIRELFGRCRELPWHLAIEGLRPSHPDFVSRLEREWLADWTLLVHPSGAQRAVDVGCGFGTLTIGLAARFAQVAAVDVLPLRLAIAASRARSLGATHVQFINGNGRVLPLRSGVFDLAVLNGVLEWAALGSTENTAVVQALLLSEVRRVLKADGLVAVAIENRFALETWNLTPDTHTGLLLLPLFPHWLGRAIHRLRVGRRLSVQLYSRRGYRHLLRSAGFSAIRILDVAPSYNDYDVVIDPTDGPSYRFLWRLGVMRSFNTTSHNIRRQVARVFPRLLGRLSYAYLVIAGDSVATVLDSGHPLWAALQPYGITPGKYRFACRGRSNGSLLIVVHTGQDISTIVEIGCHAGNTGSEGLLPAIIRLAVSPDDYVLGASARLCGAHVRAWTRRLDSPPVTPQPSHRSPAGISVTG